MKEYIEREALIELIENNSETKFDWSECVDIDVLRPAILDIPAADVVEVKHGEWVKFEIPHMMKCSECGVSDLDIHRTKFDFCPYCGAKMDGGKSNG